MLTDIPVEDDRTPAALAAQAADYADLSHWYAGRGDTRRAMLSAWAADVRTVQSLVWEKAGGSGGEPMQMLWTVAGQVESALTGQALNPATSPRGIMQDAREALLGALDAPVRDLLVDRFVDLDHLDGLPASAPGAANAAVGERLGGRSGEQLVGDLLTAAEDCRLVGHVMAQIGDDDEAQRQAASADLAGFEAYLVMVSAASGDATLATADLRWDLAAAKAARGDTSGSVELGLVAVQRAAMRSVVAPAEEPSLLAVLDLADTE